ncbi:hypothetical protein S7711_11468 [Stachybotrys chartarum IBT 7711]|uniref:Uncharacterized protein n=1 Tax=Stachybotrys chartarum (strain CBS 109288 / IBT 7711) TaxID=1280523 RepID=A0A084BBG2_STACB|nr:hypothetical protein S7711_11468 [Stachybotrys chartarum IBT 7711]
MGNPHPSKGPCSPVTQKHSNHRAANQRNAQATVTPGSDTLITNRISAAAAAEGTHHAILDTLPAPQQVLRANGPFRVPDADADDTNAAWIEVRKYHEMFSRAAKRNSRCGIPSDTGRSSLSDQPSLVDVGESVSTPDSTLTSRTGSTPRSARSADLVLLPRGIRVKDTNVIVPSAFAHFKTNRPPEGHYKVEELSHTDIWVSSGDDWVRSLSNEYREMKVLGLCEEEFASFANDQFLRRSPRYLPDSDDRQWRGERMLQLVSPPKENTHWRKPPVLDTAKPSVDWSWDIVT